MLSYAGIYENPEDCRLSASQLSNFTHSKVCTGTWGYTHIDMQWFINTSKTEVTNFKWITSLKCNGTCIY